MREVKEKEILDFKIYIKVSNLEKFNKEKMSLNQRQVKIKKESKIDRLLNKSQD